MNKNIRVQNFAVWDKEETLEFSLMLDWIGASRSNQLLLKEHNHMRRKQITVPAIPLDTFVERNGIERVDFIKADIEGAERNMLRGATNILRTFAPKLSICTYHIPDDPQVLREIILEANPKYQIVERFRKMYAHVP
jgi:FkbM family methyltransferase